MQCICPSRLVLLYIYSNPFLQPPNVSAYRKLCSATFPMGSNGHCWCTSLVLNTRKCHACFTANWPLQWHFQQHTCVPALVAVGATYANRATTASRTQQLLVHRVTQARAPGCGTLIAHGVLGNDKAQCAYTSSWPPEQLYTTCSLASKASVVPAPAWLVTHATYHGLEGCTARVSLLFRCVTGAHTHATLLVFQAAAVQLLREH